MNWLIDLVMGIPHTVLLILIAFACGKAKGVLIGVAVTQWTGACAYHSQRVLQIRSQQYIEFPQAGAQQLVDYGKHILPHMVPQFLIGLILMFPTRSCMNLR